MALAPACFEPPSSLCLALSAPRSTWPWVRKSKSFFSPGQAISLADIASGSGQGPHFSWQGHWQILLVQQWEFSVTIAPSKWSFPVSPGLVLPLNGMQRWQGLYHWRDMTCYSETVESLCDSFMGGCEWEIAARLAVAWEGHREEGRRRLACPGPPVRLFGPTPSFLCCYRFESKYPNQKSPVKCGASLSQVRDSHLVNGVLGVCIHSLWIF